MKSKYIKTRIRLKTRAVLATAVLSLLWILIDGRLNFFELHRLGLTRNLIASGVVVLAVLFAAINAVPGNHLKERLVFLRWKHPLPGSRAFTSTFLARDTRIDANRLRAHIGGSLPRAPAEQNGVWYRLYRSVEHDERVAGIHEEYLLFRDLTWFLALVAVISFSCAVLINSHRQWLFVHAGACAAAYLLFRRAAAGRGERLVATVLAAVAAHDLPSNRNWGQPC